MKQIRDPYFLLIIGGGAAGIYISSFLKNKKNVLLIESGSKTNYSSNDPKNNFMIKGNYENGRRARGLGGTTNLWGGQMLPFSEQDISKKNNWPFEWQDLFKNYQSVSNNLFGDNYFSEQIKNSNFNVPTPKLNNSLLYVHHSRWLKEPNFKKLLKPKYKNKIESIFNSTVKFIEKTNDKNYLVTYETNQKDIFKIKAKNIVIATGTIETNRLLLMCEKYKKLILPKNLGKGFMDHLSIPICQLKPKNRFRFLKKFNTRYLNNGKKYSVRISASEEFYKANKSLNISSGIQISEPKKFWQNLINLFSAFLSTKIFGVVIKPFGKINLNLILEQRSLFSRSITLNNNDIPLITWKKNKEEANLAAHFSNIIIDQLYSEKLLHERPKIPTLETICRNLKDVNHPMGGVQMHKNKSSSLVTSDLQLKGYKNLYICSGAVFTSGSHSNPTMTLLALADRLTKKLNQKRESK